MTDDLSQYQDPKTIQRVLTSVRNVAIVGQSPNELRSSNFVGFYLKRHGYRVIPVNPRETEVLGERSYPSLAEVPDTIDIVDVFRDPSAVPEIVNEAIAMNAKSLWLQFGVIHFEAAAQARQAGMDVVMDRCLKIEHARYLGRMSWLGFNTGVVDARRQLPG
jgi:predicted CoA-binding protein